MVNASVKRMNASMHPPSTMMSRYCYYFVGQPTPLFRTLVELLPMGEFVKAAEYDEENKDGGHTIHQLPMQVLISKN